MLFKKKSRAVCIDCGYLGRGLGGTVTQSWPEQVWEVNETERQNIKSRSYEAGLIIQLVCGRNLWMAMWDWATRSPVEDQKVFDICLQERECDCFFEYMPGYDSRQHRQLQRESQERKWTLRSSVIIAITTGLIVGLISGFFYALFSQLLT